MPLPKSAQTLRKCSMLCIANNWDWICYAAHSPREMGELMENDGYLAFEGPFVDFPSTLLEDLMEVIRSTRNLNRKFLHLLLREQLLSLNLSYGIAEIYYGIQFLPRCKRIRDLNLAYVRHVEPTHIMPVIPYLSSLVSLNLHMTCAHDPLLRMLAEYCPNLHELNLQSTFITDDGLRSLCGTSCSGEKGCQKLQRLIVSETRVTWCGAYDVLRYLPNITDFDFDKIFQVFEHLDPSSLKDSSRHQALRLRSLYSTTPSIRPESIDAAACLCPKVEILSVLNTWINNETFYKFMQFEHLKSLTIFNTEGKTVDYAEGILPVLQVIGPSLENLILSKFADVDLVSLGRSCPRLRKIAFSEVADLQTNSNGPEEGLYSLLTNLELWLDNDNNFSSYNALLQLLYNSVLLENLLIKKSDAFDVGLLQKIWMKNPMKRLSRIMLDQCNAITAEAISEFLRMENDLTTIRIWGCSKIKEVGSRQLKSFVTERNFDVYLEWFE